MNGAGFLTRLQKWAAHPVTSDMDIMDVVLTTLLVLCVAFAWTRVVGQITNP